MIEQTVAPLDAKPTDSLLPVVGKLMRHVVEDLRLFAKGHETITLIGPSGVGKTRLAYWSHMQSPRSSGPYVVIDFSTMPESLQMASLFGAKKGAYTDAKTDTVGAVDRAQSGTLFIDEIDKLSLHAQAALLRLLGEGRYRALGDIDERSANVRFVVATNIELQNAVRAGLFREDLFYRINILPMHIPPLRERVDEIMPWALFMLEQMIKAEHFLPNKVAISPEAEPILTDFNWPGNLRQLDHIIRRAYAFAKSEYGLDSSLILEDRHINRALAMDVDSHIDVQAQEQSLPSLFRAAAKAFVATAEKRGSLNLDLVDAMRGFVLDYATEKRGIDGAFRMLGMETQIPRRNHYRIARREQKRVDAFLQEFNTYVPAVREDPTDS